MSTIVAVASAPGPGARGVIRLSGPEAGSLVERAVRDDSGDPLALTERGTFTGRLDDGRGTQPALVLWMPGPGSYTREDVAELHLCGAPPLLDAALERLLELGARLAEPGEFTRRAFEHGRLDLSRAEGVLALIEAENARQARAATELLLGGLAERIEGLRDTLEEVRALCEASLDFDETDTGHVAAEHLLELGQRAREALREALSFEERREPLSGLPRLALVGAPNAGKSTLFNRLTGGDALVSGLEGTTRDGVRGLWRLAGVDCRLLDTPGLSDSDALGGEADRRAQELGRELAAGADLLLWTVEATADPEGLAAEAAALPSGPRILVRTKLDEAEGPGSAVPAGTEILDAVSLSAHTGEGLAELEAAVTRALGLSNSDPAPAGATLGRELSVRHRQALELATAHLEGALADLTAGAPLDLVAQALRDATDALDAIAGRTTPEDLLDRIFARFCLGK